MTDAPSVDQLIAYAATLSNKSLKAVGNSADFTVVAHPEELHFTLRNGKVRKAPRRDIENVLRQYNEIRSFVTTGYKKNTHNAVYLLALIRMYQSRDT